MNENLKKARRLVARHTKHGTNKVYAKKTGVITSLGSERSYRQCLVNFIRWCRLNNIAPDLMGNINTLTSYLEERSEWVKQKTLDQERQAFQIVYKQKLPYIKSLQRSVYEKRSYSLQQVNLIVKRQSEKNEITTWLSFFCGIHAHEAATILPVQERKASEHRTWDSNRFMGLPTTYIYTVVGKGGLIREVAVPQWLSQKLEANKRANPIKVSDREISYISQYDIGYGQSWSQSFSSASKAALGFSNGGHGLRHSYAKWRLAHLIDQFNSTLDVEGKMSNEEKALLVLSQELGHFRLDIVYCYLR